MQVPNKRKREPRKGQELKGYTAHLYPNVSKEAKGLKREILWLI